jgi:hypothetical protein
MINASTLLESHKESPMSDVARLEAGLNDFDPIIRRAALAALIERHLPAAPLCDSVNMHCHSFFSFNAFGWSPSRVLWDLFEEGIYAAGLCEFDVLDGLDEFLDTGMALGMRTAVHVETRAFLDEFAEHDINSPGEPGVTYVMGAGFARVPAPGSPQAVTLQKLRDHAQDRNVALMDRINPKLPDIAVDYARDVLPLTPAGAPTERHMVSAYVNRSHEAFPETGAWAAYWSPILGKPDADLVALQDNRPALEELVRAKLAKKGGIGYVQPSRETFPPVEDFFAWVSSCGAIPMDTWLDGTSGGEARDRELLECMRAKGAKAVNIVPDRNWNLKDPADRARKQAELEKFSKLADSFDMPINIGTEMNKLGQPMYDDLDGVALAPFKQSWRRGAQIMVGHTIALRYADFSYASETADAHFGNDVKKKNAWFAAVGALPPLTTDVGEELANEGAERAFVKLNDSIAQDGWMV